MRAVIVDDKFKEIKFIAEGFGPEFNSKVSKEAHAGHLVMLSLGSQNA